MGTGNKTGGRGKKPKTGSAVVFYITNSGLELAQRIRGLYPETQIIKFTAAGAHRRLPLLWKECRNFIFIMAAGIVVRTVAPLLKDKRTDPAVVVLDERGRFVISLLSGHIGGANALAQRIADFIGAQAVITTASDVQERVSLDLWAAERHLVVEDMKQLTKVSGKIVNGKTVRVFSDLSFDASGIPEEFTVVKTIGQADVIISSRLFASGALFLRPRDLVAGIGCNRGTRKEEIESVVAEVMQEKQLSLNSIRGIASIDLKKDEKGLRDYARDHDLNTEFYSADELNHAALRNKLTRSAAVKAATGAVAVAEPAALLGACAVSDTYSLIVKKQKRGNVTLAIARAEFML